jgi:hypothetical protein
VPGLRPAGLPALHQCLSLDLRPGGGHWLDYWGWHSPDSLPRRRSTQEC